MSIHGKAEQASLFVRDMFERASVEKIARGSAHAMLLGSTAFAVLGFVEDGRPSEEETVRIFACADQLSDEPANINKLSVPTACEQFKDEFATSNLSYYDYLLPSSHAFLEEKVFTSHIEEVRSKDFDQSLIFLYFALAGYGISSFNRRLRSPEEQKIITEAESILGDAPNDK